MAVFESKLDKKSDAYTKNRADQLEKLAHLRGLEQRAVDASERRRPRFEERGQLTPRDRLARLLDPGMPFLTLYNMASYCVDDPNRETSVPGGSVLAGIGYVSGVRVMIVVDDSGINAGAATEMGFRKSLEVMRIALKNKLPFIHLVESAGANLMTYKVELWAHGGSVFYMLAKLSAAGVPTLTVLHGPSTAGGAYMPGMSDYNVGVKHNGMAALGGAALVQAACRDKGWPLDKSTLYTKVTRYTDPSEVPEKLQHGAYIQGLYLEGASWDLERSMLKRQDPKVLVTELPILQVIPVEGSKLKLQNTFKTPVYVTQSRRNAMGVGLVFEADLATSEHSSHWVLQGVALSLNIDQ